MDCNQPAILCVNLNSISLSEIVNFISIVIVIIGGFFAYVQWQYANKTRRSEFIGQIIEKLRMDKEIFKTMLRIDYDVEWYDKYFHNAKDNLEYEMDKLLSYLSYICYLKKEHQITSKEFNILHYEINRVCTSFSIQCYLWNLYHFSRALETQCSFQYLIDYGIKNKLIDKKSFMNPNSDKYKKVLNF